jgi:methyl-accepting chemotaxis protein
VHGRRSPHGNDLIVPSERPHLMLALATCAASFALVAAGCGGDDESSTEKWASSVCSAVTTWKNDLDQAAQPLTDVSSLSEETVRQAADDAKSATETLADSLKGLGRPDTSSGEQVESAVDDLATEVESSAKEIETAAEGVSSLADIPSAVGTITTALTALGTTADGAVQTLEDADVSGELKTAFDQADSCGELTSSSG